MLRLGIFMRIFSAASTAANVANPSVGKFKPHHAHDDWTHLVCILRLQYDELIRINIELNGDWTHLGLQFFAGCQAMAVRTGSLSSPLGSFVMDGGLISLGGNRAYSR